MLYGWLFCILELHNIYKPATIFCIFGGDYITKNQSISDLSSQEGVGGALEKLLLSRKPSTRRVNKLKKTLKEDGLSIEIKGLLFGEESLKKIKLLHQIINSKYGPRVFVLTDGENNLTHIGKEAEIETKNPIVEVRRCCEKWELLGIFVTSNYSSGPERLYDKNEQKYPYLIKILDGVCILKIKEMAKETAKKTIGKGILDRYR